VYPGGADKTDAATTFEMKSFVNIKGFGIPVGISQA
jgi:hypothetical protein